MANKRIKLKEVLLRSAFEGLQKAIEILILALLVGAATKIVFAAVPAVAVGSFVAEVVNEKIIR